ncbi:unnamed protein product [Amoebophrya sp. A25]|nr:unnamed protein product [Amoebophrya sp. A25]|eukprot:GSA25T00023042001.1
MLLLQDVPVLQFAQKMGFLKELFALHEPAELKMLFDEGLPHMAYLIGAKSREKIEEARDWAANSFDMKQFRDQMAQVDATTSTFEMNPTRTAAPNLKQQEDEEDAIEMTTSNQLGSVISSQVRGSQPLLRGPDGGGDDGTVHLPRLVESTTLQPESTSQRPESFLQPSSFAPRLSGQEDQKQNAQDQEGHPSFSPEAIFMGLGRDSFAKRIEEYTNDFQLVEYSTFAQLYVRTLAGWPLLAAITALPFLFFFCGGLAGPQSDFTLGSRQNLMQAFGLDVLGDNLSPLLNLAPIDFGDVRDDPEGQDDAADENRRVNLPPRAAAYSTTIDHLPTRQLLDEQEQDITRRDGLVQQQHDVVNDAVEVEKVVLKEDDYKHIELDEEPLVEVQQQQHTPDSSGGVLGRRGRISSGEEQKRRMLLARKANLYQLSQPAEKSQAALRDAANLRQQEEDALSRVILPPHASMSLSRSMKISRTDGETRLWYIDVSLALTLFLTVALCFFVLFLKHHLALAQVRLRENRKKNMQTFSKRYPRTHTKRTSHGSRKKEVEEEEDEDDEVGQRGDESDTSQEQRSSTVTFAGSTSTRTTTPDVDFSPSPPTPDVVNAANRRRIGRQADIADRVAMSIMLERESLSDILAATLRGSDPKKDFFDKKLGDLSDALLALETQGRTEQLNLQGDFLKKVGLRSEPEAERTSNTSTSLPSTSRRTARSPLLEGSTSGVYYWHCLQNFTETTFQEAAASNVLVPSLVARFALVFLLLCLLSFFLFSIMKGMYKLQNHFEHLVATRAEIQEVLGGSLVWYLLYTNVPAVLFCCFMPLFVQPVAYVLAKLLTNLEGRLLRDGYNTSLGLKRAFLDAMVQLSWVMYLILVENEPGRASFYGLFDLILRFGVINPIVRLLPYFWGLYCQMSAERDLVGEEEKHQKIFLDAQLNVRRRTLDNYFLAISFPYWDRRVDLYGEYMELFVSFCYVCLLFVLLPVLIPVAWLHMWLHSRTHTLTLTTLSRRNYKTSGLTKEVLSVFVTLHAAASLLFLTWNWAYVSTRLNVVSTSRSTIIMVAGALSVTFFLYMHLLVPPRPEHLQVRRLLDRARSRLRSLIGG